MIAIRLNGKEDIDRVINLNKDRARIDKVVNIIKNTGNKCFYSVEVNEACITDDEAENINCEFRRIISYMIKQLMVSARLDDKDIEGFKYGNKVSFIIDENGHTSLTGIVAI